MRIGWDRWIFLWSDGKMEWMKGKEEGLEGLIPQGPSGDSIGFWSPSQRNLSSAVRQNIFCIIIFCSLFLLSDCRLCGI